MRPTRWATALVAAIVSLGMSPAAHALPTGDPDPEIVKPWDGQHLDWSSRLDVRTTSPYYRLVVDGTTSHVAAAGTSLLVRDVIGETTLAATDHTLQAAACPGPDTKGCGPLGAPVRFTVTGSLVDPVAIDTLVSPNGDGRLDAATLGYTVQGDDGGRRQVSVTWSITRAGLPVRGPVDLGPVTDGYHYLTWDGRDDEGRAVPDGDYRLTMTASRDVEGRIEQETKSSAAVRVDTRPGTIAGYRWTNTSLYPVADGYRDAHTWSAVTDEWIVGSLTIRDSGGTAVHRETGAMYPGTTAFRWDGRSSSGALRPAGMYTFTFDMDDDAGNRVRKTGSFALSHKKLVTKQQVVTRTPSQRVSTYKSHSCTVRGVSSYSGGYRMIDRCSDKTSSSHELQFATVAPKAHSVTSVAVATTGRAKYAPGKLYAGWWSWSKGEWSGAASGGALSLRSIGSTTALRSLGSRSAAGLVRGADRQVYVLVGLPNYYQGPYDDYDMRSVRITITYKVLV